VQGCIDLLDGHDTDDGLIGALGGPVAEYVLSGRAGSRNGYWPRVWVARGLLHTPGGLGIVETTTILLLKSFGVASDLALEAVIGWRLINFWLPIPVDAGCYISLQAELGAERISRRKALAAMAAEARPAEGRDLDAKDGNAKNVVRPLTSALSPVERSGDGRQDPGTDDGIQQTCLTRCEARRRGRSRDDSEWADGRS